MVDKEKGVIENLRRIKRNNRLINGIVTYYYDKKPVVREKYLHFGADLYIISFPKCGRTWLRLIIGKYIQECYGLKDVPKSEILELTPLSRYKRKIPTIRVTHDDDPHKKIPKDIETNKKKYRRKKIIFMVRDPRDVIV